MVACFAMQYRKLAVLLMAASLSACAQGTREGAERGAKAGAVGGLVAGAVGSILWGGDPVNDTLRSATVGAASGAAVGGMRGAEREQDRREAAGRSAQLDARNSELKARVGEQNFAATEELARCRHVNAITRAERAFAAESRPDRRRYALLIQAMAAEESENIGKARTVYAAWDRFEPGSGSSGKARTEALEGILQLQRTRQDYGLPALCT